MKLMLFVATSDDGPIPPAYIARFVEVTAPAAALAAYDKSPNFILLPNVVTLKKSI